MAKTLLDLFKGSTYDTDVKADTETLIEEETTGLRIKSGAELSNPLLYGNEVARITLRTTPVLDDMKAATTSEVGNGGILGKGISKLTGGKITSLSGVRNVINDKLGIPTLLIPTRVVTKMGTTKSAYDVMGEKNGTAIGKFLKQTRGGTPKIIVRQGVGDIIKIGKDKLREKLFGKTRATGRSFGNSNGYVNPEYSKENPYSKTVLKLEQAEIDIDGGFTRIDFSKHSPIYGVDRNTNVWDSEMGARIRDDYSKNKKIDDGSKIEELTKNSPTDLYSKNNDTESKVVDNSLISKRKLSNTSDGINAISVDDKNIKDEDIEKMNLVPFWIAKLGKKKTHFRAIITGLSENISPSWDSSNFFGNPFPFHTYTGIERSVSFTLQLYCMNKAELITMWDRVSKLTEYTYPNITSETGSNETNKINTRFVEPPIIEFRLGDIYNKKIGLLESLSYTIPDTSPWEIDPDIGILPKFIDVSISIKFIEQYDDVKNNSYYAYSNKPVN